MSATRYLLPSEDIIGALGTRVRLAPSKPPAAAETRGNVLAAAAADFAYQSFAGHLASPEGPRPFAVGTMALVFDRENRAERTFRVVAEAAHLRTSIGASDVAVETVTGATGLVSYWGYVRFRAMMVVLTLDTLDPTLISMSDFRALVKLAADRLEGVNPVH